MVAAPPPQLPPVLRSWADHEHGWRAGDGGVEATDDGGHRWHVVFRVPELRWLTRTSPSAGLVGAGTGVFVTKDRGRHWFRVSGFAATNAVGRASTLFVADGTQLLQALQWPPSHLHAGMTIPTELVYTLAVNQALRLRSMFYGHGVQGDVLEGGAVVARLTHVDSITNIDEVMTSPPPIQSWADREHAWRGTAKGVEATSDGGAHWRLVFPLGVASGAGVDVLHRTSATAGLVSIAGRLWVTIDAGRHWYQSTGGPTEPSFAHGSLLVGTGGTGIDRAVQWPPRRVRCTGRWVHSAAWFSALTAGPKPRRICQQDSGVDIAMRRVWTEPPNDGNWVVNGRHLVNGTLTADVLDESTEQFRLVGTVVYRNGRATFTPATTPR